MDAKIKAAFERSVRERDPWNVPPFRLSETGAMYEAESLRAQYNSFAAGFRENSPDQQRTEGSR